MALRRFDQQLTSGETNTLLGEVASQMLDQLHDRALAHSIHEALKREDWVYLCEFSPDYTDISVADALVLRQVLAFFQKRVDLDLGIDADANALVKFMEAEELCRASNDIFMKWRQGGFRFPPDVDRVFYVAAQKIAAILGDVPSLSDLRFRFGPGATTTTKKQESCPRNKLGRRIDCSENLSPRLEELRGEMPRWFDVWADENGDSTVRISDGKLSFVPKSYKTSRCVVTEPVLNGFIQLGIGDYIVERLRVAGLDLTTQENKNKNLARIGSLTGALATLDLSSASDTISMGIVEHLLPPDWYDFLCSFRTPRVVLPGGDPMWLSKFSSMGNGFTFPLETLIFYSLSLASTHMGRDLVNCYGDDIIVPVESVDLLKRVLCSAGFLLNGEKSFSEGRFRESCGGDYLRGIDIRPVYVKDRLSCSDVFRVHNFLWRAGQHEACAALLNAIHADLRIFGPDGFGDGHLLGDWLPTFKEQHKARGYGGATFDTFTFKPRRFFKKSLPGDFVFPAYSVYTSPVWEVDPDMASFFGKVHLKQHGSYRPTESTARVRHDKNGDPTGMETPIQGTKGYARISIYLLNPWAH